MTKESSIENIKRLRDLALRCSDSSIYTLADNHIGPKTNSWFLFLSQDSWDDYLRSNGLEKDHEKKIRVDGKDVYIHIPDFKSYESELVDSRKASKKFYMDIDKNHKRKPG